MDAYDAFNSYMLNYDGIVFPVFTVHTDDVDRSDGMLWVENQVLDDRNMSGNKVVTSSLFAR